MINDGILFSLIDAEQILIFFFFKNFLSENSPIFFPLYFGEIAHESIGVFL